MKNSFFSSRAFRKGSLSLIFTVIMIVAIVLLNILVTAVSNKYPFSLDLTADQDYTVTLEDEYKTFVEGVASDVEMIVCASEDDFENGAYASYMAQNLTLVDAFMGDFSESTPKYARQVALFMKSFPTMNKHFKVTFLDLNSPTEASSITKRYPDETLQYGDIIVSCNHPATDGGTFERHHVIPMTDIFTVEQNQEFAQYGYTANTITGSSLAGGVVSALYIVTRSSSVEVAVLSSGSEQEDAYVENLETFLEKNNYTFTKINNILTEKIAEETKFLVVAAPQKDLSAEEVKKLDEFLKNDGNYGRSLVYLPSIYQPELPKLEEFLQEWGIEILPAYAVDEDNAYYDYYSMGILAQAGDSDFTADMGSQYFAPTMYRALRTTFESQNGYTTKKLLVTGENSYGVPLTEESLPEDWTGADSDYQGQLDLAVMSTYQYMASSTSQAVESNVIVLSGESFFSTDGQGASVLSSAGYYNATFTLNLFNGLSGQEEGVSVQIQDKVINTKSFLTEIQDKNTPQVVSWLFMAVVPVALFVISLVIWIKRKRR